MERECYSLSSVDNNAGGLVTLVDTSSSHKDRRGVTARDGGAFTNLNKSLTMCCAYYVTFPDANLLTLETYIALPWESFCFSIR